MLYLLTKRLLTHLQPSCDESASEHRSLPTPSHHEQYLCHLYTGHCNFGIITCI